MARIPQQAAAFILPQRIAFSARRMSIERLLKDCFAFFKKPSGWKRAARVNCVILITIDILLVIFLIISTTSTNSFSKAFMFFQGTCGDGSVSKLNMLLHLLLNTVSTVVFASSNFFMQVINSATRQELDLVHTAGLCLDIGVPSMTNAFRLGKFKLYTWILLFLSSVPLHLLFNSIIFQTDSRGGDYRLTVASPGFVRGQAFYPPGATLQVLGPSNLLLNLSDATDPTTEANINITAAAEHGAQWTNLSYVDCYNEYFVCDGGSSYKDLVIIVNNTGGWTLEDVWTLLPNQTAFWNTKGIPPKASNSLWYSTQCIVRDNVLYSITQYQGPNPHEEITNLSRDLMLIPMISQMRGTFVDNLYFYCSSNCANYFKSYQSPYLGGGRMTYNEPWTIHNLDFFREVHGERQPYVWEEAFDEETRLNLNRLSDDAGWSEVSYCLAKPDERICHLVLSSSLLLVVTLSVMMKSFIAIIITCRLSQRKHTPLATLGDAISSFVKQPDCNTINMCTFDSEKVHRAMKSFKPALPGPQRWTGRVQRRWSILPKGTWTMSYLIFASGITIMVYFYNDGTRRGTM